MARTPPRRTFSGVRSPHPFSRALQDHGADGRGGPWLLRRLPRAVLRGGSRGNRPRNPGFATWRGRGEPGVVLREGSRRDLGRRMRVGPWPYTTASPRAPVASHEPQRAAELRLAGPAALLHGLWNGCRGKGMWLSGAESTAVVQHAATGCASVWTPRQRHGRMAHRGPPPPGSAPAAPSWRGLLRHSG